MPRTIVPTKIREAVLAEYSHKCAICGSERPHLHHIDEDNSNNVTSNLLPLCPNCHLRDQHNPTKRLDTDKLGLFREYKDPSILTSQFHPTFLRQRFLSTIKLCDEDTGQIEAQCVELIEFISTFEMGVFYAKKLKELMQPNQSAYVFSMLGTDTPDTSRKVAEANRKYREELLAARPAIQYLLVEQLRYQTWAK